MVRRVVVVFGVVVGDSTSPNPDPFPPAPHTTNSQTWSLGARIVQAVDSLRSGASKPASLTALAKTDRLAFGISAKAAASVGTVPLPMAPPPAPPTPVTAARAGLDEPPPPVVLCDVSRWRRASLGARGVLLLVL